MDPRRTRYTSSALARQLTRLTGAQAPESRQPFAEALSQWLGWTDAISLSAALNTAPAAGKTAPPSARSAAEGVERIKAGLARAIADACAAPGPAARTSRRPPEPAPEAPTDYGHYRQRYLATQQAMEERIESLRQRLRTQLAAASPDGARLAAVDAVMEQVLAQREQLLLHAISTQRLEKRFDSLKPPGDDVAAGLWLDTFRQDMHAVLLAELDTRMQPVEGLLAALRSAPDSR
jgi:hypothetical protein